MLKEVCKYYIVEPVDIVKFELVAQENIIWMLAPPANNVLTKNSSPYPNNRCPADFAEGQRGRAKQHLAITCSNYLKL